MSYPHKSIQPSIYRSLIIGRHLGLKTQDLAPAFKGFTICSVGQTIKEID